MSAATALRLHIEQSLVHRFPAALSPAAKTVYETSSSGLSAIDTLLDGGFPMGAISELAGPVSSGRTSLALSFLAQRTAEGKACAWVDTDDTLDPESAAASGVNLQQLLWVRCGVHTPSVNTGRGVRTRSRQATSGAETRIEQALRATDLLLQAGGFASIVLDFGDTEPLQGARIPLATWFRFRQAAERTHTCLLVLCQSNYAQSSAALVLECRAQHLENRGSTVLKGMRYEVQKGRQRFAAAHALHDAQRKQPASSWTATGCWIAEKSA